jgi:hypothetical protein
METHSQGRLDRWLSLRFLRHVCQAVSLNLLCPAFPAALVQDIGLVHRGIHCVILDRHILQSDVRMHTNQPELGHHRRYRQLYQSASSLHRHRSCQYILGCYFVSIAHPSRHGIAIAASAESGLAGCLHYRISVRFALRAPIRR